MAAPLQPWEVPGFGDGDDSSVEDDPESDPNAAAAVFVEELLPLHMACSISAQAMYPARLGLEVGDAKRGGGLQTEAWLEIWRVPAPFEPAARSLQTIERSGTC